jgi:flavin reductase (DIM6/NTAB) family NADH-FMN oxidoreductase RutF
LVAVSLAKATRTYQLIKRSQIFAVNILGQGQQATSSRFANSTHDAAERFDDEPHRTIITGSPVLERAIAFADCHVVTEFDVGLNVIVIGMVETGEVQHNEMPLIYSDRQYWKLTK